MDPITLICPRGLGDAVVSLPVAYALHERGHRVNLRNAGSVQFAEYLPTLVPVGIAREGEVRDCCARLSFHSPLRMLAQVSLQFGVFPLAIPEGPWLRAKPEYAETVRGFGLEPGAYIAVSACGFQDYRRLDPPQVQAIADASDLPVVAVCDRPLEGMPGVDLTGRTTLPELFALLAHARAAVCVDSGPLHTCGALGTPVLAVIGETLNPYSFCEDYTPSLWLTGRASYEIPPAAVAKALCRLLEESSNANAA